MDKRTLKDNVYNEISRITKAISNSNRLEIIDYLANGEKCVEDIAIQTGISIANASQHLQTLKRERLVIARKVGVQVCYSLASEKVYLAWKSMRDLTFSVSPILDHIVGEHRKSNDFSLPFSLKEIQQRNDVCFLDVRPNDEYKKGHIPNSLSVPIQELTSRITEIPKDKLVIAYCRGMFCTMADEAVKVLLENGFNAKKIEENIIEYQLINE